MERHQEANGFETDSLNITEQEHIFKIYLDPLPLELTLCAQGLRQGEGWVSWGNPFRSGCMPLHQPPLCPRLLVLGLASWILSSNRWWVCVLARKNKLAGLAETLKLK